VNRERFGFGEGLFEQRRLILERERVRERGACEGLDGGCFWDEAELRGRERFSEVVWWLKAFSMNMEAARTLGAVGFNLLTQLTKITTSLYIFDKQWHTCL